MSPVKSRASNKRRQFVSRATTYEIYKDAAGEFRYRIRARNGEILGTSEGYKSKFGAEKGRRRAFPTAVAR